jgi:hypothetical protein
MTEIGADTNIPNTININNTVLQYAAVSGSVYIIKLLLDK